MRKRWLGVFLILSNIKDRNPDTLFFERINIFIKNQIEHKMNPKMEQSYRTIEQNTQPKAHVTSHYYK
jgi:hypothetical protein